MKLKNFLKEGIVQQALNIPEPEVGGDYPPEKVKRYMEIIDKALDAMKDKDNNDANDAIVADLRDKKKKWGSVDKETKPTKTKTEIPPEQRQDDDPDVQNPPPEEEEPPPEEKPKDEEPPPEEDEEGKDKKKKKKVPPQFQKKEEYEFKLMTPFEKAMKEQEDPVTGKRCYVFHRDTNGKKKRKNKKMREALDEKTLEDVWREDPKRLERDLKKAIHGLKKNKKRFTEEDPALMSLGFGGSDLTYHTRSTFKEITYMLEVEPSLIRLIPKDEIKLYMEWIKVNNIPLYNKVK